jgi:uncharacterized protein (TIGR01777 family)
MSTILITGGTGVIGTALTKALLEKDYNVIILTRNPEKFAVSTSRVSYAGWNFPNQAIDKEAITKSDYIIHLAGAGIADKRWTKKRKQEIVDSRVKNGELLVKALKENANNVKAVISASAIGWYGEGSGLRKFEESDPPANDFLGQTCKQWEESLERVTLIGKRLVKIRTGIVLSNEGGALAEFLKPLRFGIASILSNGKQIVSWIHIEDLIRIYIAAIENQAMNGIYNAVAPRPVSNKELVLQLAKIKRGRFFVPVHVPSFVLKLILGEMGIEVLKSASVSCDKIHFTGFIFLYPSLEATLEQLAG